MAHNRWSDKEVAYLVKNYCRMSITELSKFLKRSIDSVQGKIRQLKLSRTKRNSIYSVKSYIANLREINIETEVENQMMIDSYSDIIKDNT